VTRSGNDSGGIHIVLAIGAAAVMLLVVILLSAAGGLLGPQAAACGTQPAASRRATGTIPASYLALYQQTGLETGIPWNVLAGIGEVESDHGRSTAPGVHSGANAAGAAGPMQIGVGGAADNTWGGVPIHPASEHTGGYGIDGDHDGQVDVYDPGDAIPSAAAILKAAGAPGNITGAIFAYKHSQDYVNAVLSWAARYASGGAQLIAAQQNPACAQAAAGPLPQAPQGKSSPTPKLRSANRTNGAPPDPTHSTAPG